MLLPGPATHLGRPRFPLQPGHRYRISPGYESISSIHTPSLLCFFWFFILLVYNYSYIVVRPKKRHTTVTWTPAKGGSIPNTPANCTGPGRGGIPATLKPICCVSYFGLRMQPKIKKCVVGQQSLKKNLSYLFGCCFSVVSYDWRFIYNVCCSLRIYYCNKW